MQEELDTVEKDIKDLEERLEILKKRKAAIEDKLDLPMDYIGKCLKNDRGSNTTSYLKVKNISKSKAFNCILLEGIYLRIDYFAKGSHYNIHNNGVLAYKPEELEEITEEEFNRIKEEIIEHFD